MSSDRTGDMSKSIKGECKMSERELQGRTIELARLCGYYVYHTHDSRRSEPGFPDMIAVHESRPVAIVAEFKSETGKLTKGHTDQRGRYHPGQADWLRRWHDISTNPESRIYTRLWRPGHTDEIEDMLTQGGR